MKFTQATTQSPIKAEVVEEPVVQQLKVEPATSEESLSMKIETPVLKKVTSNSKSTSNRKRESNTNKNIVKNYARAMSNFALSKTALPYLQEILESQGKVSLRGFKMFIKKNKEDITSIRRLRELLLITEEDAELVCGYKNVFKALSMVFLKSFSVNWIYASKVSDKLTHVKYRFKMMRRVENPEYFTYLEDFARK